MGLDVGGGSNNFEFNAFSAPATQPQTNNLSYSPPIIKQEPANNYNYGMLSANNEAQNKSNFQLPTVEAKSLDAAAD